MAKKVVYTKDKSLDDDAWILDEFDRRWELEFVSRRIG